MTLDEQLEILQAAKRGEKFQWRFVDESSNENAWYDIKPEDLKHYLFDFYSLEYRIVDPYAELKAAAKDQTKQIRVGSNGWKDAGYEWEWLMHPSHYEIRDKPKAKKMVKYLCWEDIELKYLMWFNESAENETCGMIRRPVFDKECEVEDE